MKLRYETFEHHHSTIPSTILITSEFSISPVNVGLIGLVQFCYNFSPLGATSHSLYRLRYFRSWFFRSFTQRDSSPPPTSKWEWRRRSLRQTRPPRCRPGSRSRGWRRRWRWWATTRRAEEGTTIGERRSAGPPGREASRRRRRRRRREELANDIRWSHYKHWCKYTKHCPILRFVIATWEQLNYTNIFLQG